MRNFLSSLDEQTRLIEVDRLTADFKNGSDAVLNRVVAMMLTHFGVPTALVSIVDRDHQIFKARIGFEFERTDRAFSFCAHNLTDTNVMEICDALEDPRFTDNPLVRGAPFIRYYAGAPLMSQPGLGLGSLCILDSEVRPPMSEADKRLLQDASSLVVAHLQSIHQQNYFDPMTGLPNRQRFEIDIHDVETVQTDCAAVLIEPLSAIGMDRLVKSLGLGFFTNFMLAVKEMLLKELPVGTRLYRSSTLSFAIVIEQAAGNELPALLNRITEALARPLHSDRVPVFADVGISVLTLGPNTDVPWDSFRLMASITDAARGTENRWLYYDPQIDSSLRRSTVLLNDIEAALLAPDQLRLVYQPRVDLGDNSCLAVEALLRWKHPTLGEISPAEFIGLAETTASIRHITRWVVERVGIQLAQWRAQGLTITVSLNVSAVDLTDGRLFEEFSQTVEAFSIAPTDIELEFTESALVSDFDSVQEQLERFRALGVAIGIDDFGSGYSNWNYLRQIPATSVKLDRSLLEDLSPGSSDWHIVRGLISLARDLNLKVVAEGVETELHYHLLRGWGCHEGQGYYFARPLPPDELVAWLQA